MRKVMAISLLLFLGACSRHLNSAEVQDKDLLIQVMEHKLPADSGAMTYKVRIFPAQNLDGKAKSALNEQMEYHADSSFYLNTKGLKQYADEIVPIANGVKNCYEYLVIFSGKAAQKQTLYYQDQFINQKKYQLSLK